ncbi:MAG: YciI family protein [Ectothiorhodospiraceae bacterium]|nr:YciI family protein [Ectothiorhodospiraceae bacterium]MCH8506382.1 YciI family protein [Ectothiorhodospiraceae bacterium]
MKFLCLAYEQEQVLNALSREEWLALRQETLDYVRKLRQEGQLLATHALRSAGTAKTLQRRSGETTVTDGPFAETKEQIGGYFLIEAADMDAALRIAGGWPSARIGTIEVRPIEETLPEERRY